MADGVRFKLTNRQRPISLDGYREAARRALPEMIWAYVDGGAETMTTVRDNRSAFGRWRLRQRALVGPNPCETGVSLHGTALAMPVALAPTGLTGLVHWQGDVGAARAAEAHGTRLILSGCSSYSIEEVAGATKESHWFQLYPFSRRDLTESTIDRARRSGYGALVVTIDVPVPGNREGERLLGLGVPPVMTPGRSVAVAMHPRWAYGFLRHRRMSLRNLTDSAGFRAGTRSTRTFLRMVSDANTDWDDLAWIREQWDGPLYVKGILDAEDSLRAVEAGVDGIVVSNHGGRQLDFAPSSLDALPPIAAAVGERATVILDGGVRRGTDVVKALCLGADACLIGRPLMYGLAVDGQAGVSRVLEIIKEELDRTMHLIGCKSVRDLDPSWLIESAGGDHDLAGLLG